MSFAQPWILLLMPLALLALRRRRFRAIRVPSLRGWGAVGESRRLRWAGRMRTVRTLAFALMILALAGPMVQRPVEESLRRGIAIVMLVDISSSMDCILTGAGETRQTRMEAAREVVCRFIAARENDLIGLITFARYPDTVSPLTFGHKALIQLAGAIEIQDRPNEDGTAYGDALMQACAQLEQMAQWQGSGDRVDVIRSKVVVLLTDGENNCGRHLPQEAAGVARKWGIRLYVITLGESDESGRLTAAERLLQSVAETGGGCFWKIDDEAGLSRAYAEIDALEKSEITDTAIAHREIVPVFALFLLPALILLTADTVLSATLLRVNQEVEA